MKRSTNSGIRLGVNIDHVATLRQVRRARYPDIVEAMHLCQRGGADQITVHLREDRRHIQDEDVKRLLEASLLPINLEMAFVEDMLTKALEWQPFAVTLVPERREEMTTESGLNLERIEAEKDRWLRLNKALRCFAFIDPEPSIVQKAFDLGFEGVEFHTGPYSAAFEKALRGKNFQADLDKEKERLFRSARAAAELGLEVKAGHGLTIQNVAELKDLPEIHEFNIGHSIIARSILIGLEAAVREMKDLLR